MSKKRKDHLDPANCNKAKCKTCIFHPDQKIVSQERLAEIQTYLITSSSHLCHTTGKTCYGGLEFQAQVFFRLGIIPEESVDCFLQTANKYLRAVK